MKGCIFCRIIKGEMPSYKIYEDDKYLAFLDIYPKTEGHTLVIPKNHVEWVWDDENVGEYFEVASKIAKHLRKVSGQTGVRGFIYGFDVPHAHVHLMPGKKNEYEGKKLSGEELKKIQQKFKMEFE